MTDTAFDILCIVSSLVDGLVAVAVVLWFPFVNGAKGGAQAVIASTAGPRTLAPTTIVERRITLRRLLLAVVVTCVLFVLKIALFVTTRVGVGLFGIIRLTYIDLVVTVPAVAWIVLLFVAGRGGINRLARSSI